MSADETADAIQGVEEPGGSKRFSYAYITSLLLLAIAGAVGAVYFGYVTPDVTVEATFNIGWIIEYGVGALVGLFVFWTFAQVVNIIGVGFIAGVVRVAARIADNYELPERREADDD